ncbi:serine protease snake-like [Bombyx mandarina]|uniref:Serine protease snake-like n=1 Tax=Bombyx mandarina TaxID=7092 RepID=A0A6J2KM01_BOMMA|nr:serine protease snake-like [Bombyx mandarina]
MSRDALVSCALLCAVLCALLPARHGAAAADVEGTPCVRGRFNGTCVLSKRCETLILDYRDRSFPPVCGLRGKEPIVCCTDCELVDNIDNIYLTRRYSRLEKTNKKSWDACIDYVLNIPEYFCTSTVTFNFNKAWDSEKKCHKISISSQSPVGGEDAERAEFPFMALLGFGPSAEEAQWLCGGSVLSARYILTAAHCISEPRLGPLKYAALGILKRSDPPEIWQRHTLAQVIPHPDYASPSKYHDIALLKTEKQIIFNVNVVPACLYSGVNSKRIDPTRALALGWGYLGPRERLADVLQKVEVSEFTTEECLTQYPEHRHLLDGFDNSTQMCYGDHDTPHDTCEGDSGGPLILHESEAGCARAVFGVTSSGVACGDAGAGLYTRVEPYKPWIESIVWP